MTMRSSVSKAKSAIKSALKSNVSASDDILSTLKSEHNEVKELLNQLEDETAAGRRRTLVQKIKQALVPHTKAEESVVYDAVIALRDRDAQTDGHEGYLEHELAAAALKKLEKIEEASSPEHKATAKVLKELVEHHIKEEEDQVWSDVKDNFSDEQRQDMNRRFLLAKERVRLPH